MLGSILASPLAILLAIVALGVLMIVHEGGHYLAARASGMRVDRFTIGLGPAITQFKRGDTVWQIGWIPFGAGVQVAGLNPGDDTISADDPRSYPNRPLLHRMIFVFAGPATNYLFAILTMVFVYTVFGLPTPSGPPIVVSLVPNYPAQVAGIQPNDEVVSIAGRPVKESADVKKIVNESQDKALDVVVLRDHVEKHVTVTPKKDGSAYFIGVQIEPRDAVWQRTTVGEGAREGLNFPVRQTKAVLLGLAQIFQGKQKADFTGPVGIVSEMKKQILRGTPEGLSIVAFISTLLGIFNLLPLPALDGGRLVFLLLEMFSRRRFPRRIEESIHLVGMLALLSFIFYITVFKDIPRHFLK